MKRDHLTSDVEFNKVFIVNHFEEFVNKKNSAIAYVNLSVDFVDHDESGGTAIGPEPAKEMMEKLYAMIPDIHVSVMDIIAEGDKVMVRNIWSGTHVRGERIQFRGFVLWRLKDGKIIERWATVTPSQPVKGDSLNW